jgi:LysR family transcriptional regulator for bpeEF and oprC
MPQPSPAAQEIAAGVKGTPITRAADALDIPKATASKLVAELESHLRIKLLNRTTRSVQATADGAVYYERVSKWLRELDDIESAFDSNRVKPHGRIVVDASAWVAATVLVPALPSFYEEYPGILIDLGVSDRTVDLIIENADCVIRGGNLTNQSTVGRSLGQSRWITAAASPDYLRRHGVPDSPEDLAKGHNLISYQLAASGRGVPFRFKEGEREFEIEGASALSVNESNAHLAAALAGIGVVQTFEWKLRPYLQSGELVSFLDDWSPGSYAFHVLYPPNRFMNTWLRVFIDWLFKVFGEFDRG